MSIFDAILKAITLPLKIIISIFIFTLIILLLPDKYIKALGIALFLTTQKQWIILVNLFAGILILVNVAYGIINIIKMQLKKQKRKAQEKINNENIDKKLLDLDYKEKAVLREFIIKGAYAIKLPALDPAVINLVNYHILESISDLYQDSVCGPLYSLRISEYARDRLTNEVFGIPDMDNLSEMDRQYIFNNRPQFMKKLERLKDIYQL